MKNEDLVSIITATFNSKECIDDTWKSIQQQNYQNWEWLITDDCSTDGTYEHLLYLAANDDRIKPVRLNVNSGAAVARNSSLDRASGLYLAFIDSDDLWYPEKLECQIHYMLAHNLSFSFTAFECVDAAGKPLNVVIDSKHTNLTFNYKDMLKKRATLGCSTVILHRDLIQDIRMPEIRTGQDYAFWLKILKVTNAHCFNSVLTQYRLLPNSLSRNKFKKARRQWQIYRELERLPFALASYCFCFYAVRAIFRK